MVRDYTGHGIGRTFHSGLVILHYDEPSVTTVIEKGMTFTIEPMITLGGIDWDIWDDNWTVTTKDKSWTAQFEHTLVVTDTGAEVLTLPVNEAPGPRRACRYAASTMVARPGRRSTAEPQHGWYVTRSSGKWVSSGYSS